MAELSITAVGFALKRRYYDCGNWFLFGLKVYVICIVDGKMVCYSCGCSA